VGMGIILLEWVCSGDARTPQLFDNLMINFTAQFIVGD